MRDIGYSIGTALADLIDNSISAKATSVDIVFDVSDAEPVVVIADNGRGMTEPELLQAMRHGGGEGRGKRAAHDLGRFGLGLKTASFSQCRCLTVVSFRDGVRCGAEWDLDRIDARDEWLLSLLDEPDLENLPHMDRLTRDGTIVIWRKLDRLSEGETGNGLQTVVNEKIQSVESHLSLVFHRFLSGEVKGSRKLSISLNGISIKPFDPFCRSHKATQVLPEEIVRIGREEVRMIPYILPHHSRMTASEQDFYQSRSEFVSNQGCYIYRNGRLMAWGDWFRLIPKGESTKLARVQIDFSNSLDEAWTIDIKKSRATPPSVVRNRLRQIIDKVRERSVRVHKGRGELILKTDLHPVWKRYQTHEGFRYAVNPDHPLIQKLESGLPSEGVRLLHVLLNSISASIPIEMIYSDYSTSPRDLERGGLDECRASESLMRLRNAFPELGKEVFMEIVDSCRIFEGHQSVVDRFVDDIFG